MPSVLAVEYQCAGDLNFSEGNEEDQQVRDWETDLHVGLQRKWAEVWMHNAYKTWLIQHGAGELTAEVECYSPSIPNGDSDEKPSQ